jgi:hypothetical protein
LPPKHTRSTPRSLVPHHITPQEGEYNDMLVRYHRLVQQEGKRKTKKIDTPSSPTPKEELPTPVANSLARDTSSSLMRAATTTATTASVAAAASSATTAPSGLATRVSKQPEAVVGGAGDAASLAAHSAHVTSRRPLRVVSSNDDIARKDVAVTQVKPTTTISSGQVYERARSQEEKPVAGPVSRGHGRSGRRRRELRAAVMVSERARFCTCAIRAKWINATPVSQTPHARAHTHTHTQHTHTHTCI